MIKNIIKEEIDKLDKTLPTQKMIDWFNYEFNQEPEGMDSLESDDWTSNQKKEFFEEFENDLRDLSYFQKLDVFEIAKYS